VIEKTSKNLSKLKDAFVLVDARPEFKIRYEGLMTLQELDISDADALVLGEWGEACGLAYQPDEESPYYWKPDFIRAAFKQFKALYGKRSADKLPAKLQAFVSAQLTITQFETLAGLISREPGSPATIAARMVLVEGVSQIEASRTTGATPSTVNDTVKRYLTAAEQIKSARFV